MLLQPLDGARDSVAKSLAEAEFNGLLASNSRDCRDSIVRKRRSRVRDRDILKPTAGADQPL